MRLVWKRAANWSIIVLTLFLAAPLAGAKESEKQDDPAKFFLFHKEGVTEDGARGDILYCVGQSVSVMSSRAKMQGVGLLGFIINDRLGDIDTLRMRNAAMRKCMGLHGYQRYAIPEVEWKVFVNHGDIVVANDGKASAQVIDRMAVYASGPKPQMGAVAQ